jgi:hypothetical protein
VGVEGGPRQHHRSPARGARGVARLVALPLHARRGFVALGPRGVLSAL